MGEVVRMLLLERRCDTGPFGAVTAFVRITISPSDTRSDDTTGSVPPSRLQEPVG